MTKVVVAGAGSIGSLLAAHLALVADVTVLTRREEHAAALSEHCQISVSATSSVAMASGWASCPGENSKTLFMEYPPLLATPGAMAR